MSSVLNTRISRRELQLGEPKNLCSQSIIQPKDVKKDTRNSKSRTTLTNIFSHTRTSQENIAEKTSLGFEFGNKKGSIIKITEPETARNQSHSTEKINFHQIPNRKLLHPYDLARGAKAKFNVVDKNLLYFL